MRIRLRLALYGAGVVAVAMFAFGLLLNGLVRSGAPGGQVSDLADIADRAVEAAAAGDLAAAGEPLVKVELATSTEVFISFVDVQGNVIYGTGEVLGQAPRIPAAVVVEAMDTGVSTAVIYPVEGVALRIVAKPWSNGSDSGVAVAGQATRFTEEQIAGFRVVIWASGIITLIAAAVVSWLVSGRALRPLHELAETTDRIGSTGDLSRRLPAKRVADEVGRLTTSFNTMLDRLEKTQSQLAAALEAQRRFVADASHELRSPLTTIRSNAGFLVNRGDAALDDQREAVSDIAAEADRMGRLVDDLLTLARADEAVVPTREPVDLAFVLDQVRDRAHRSGIELKVAASQALTVEGDARGLERAIWILVDNAGKHGGGDVTIGVTRRDGIAVISVADRGPGIPVADVGRVFDRFYRADPARRPAGTGLGLAIAKWVIESHDGTIAAANAPDGGAIFTIELPIAPGR